MGKTRDTGFLTDCVFTDSSNNVGIGGAANASYKLAVTGASLFSGAGTFSGTITSQSNGSTFGTASASGRAVIIQAGSTSQAIMFKNAAGGDGTLFINGTSTTLDYNFNTYSVGDALVIKNNGNVGISTSSPAVHGNAGYTTLTIRSSGTNRGWLELGNTTASTSDIFGQISGFNGTNARAGEVRFYSDGAVNKAGIEFAVLNSGTVTPAAKITSTGQIFINNATNFGSTYAFLFKGVTGLDNFAAVGVRTNGDNIINWFNASNTYVASIVINASSVSYGTGSDYRLKEDLKDFNGLEKVSAIKVYDFKFKEEGDRMEGVLAHELQEVIPYAVSGVKDELDADGNAKIQNVDYSKIVPVLIKAIQELNAKVTALENQS